MMKYQLLISRSVAHHSANNEASIKPVIQDLAELIHETALSHQSKEDIRAIWKKRIIDCALNLDLEINPASSDWNAFNVLLSESSNDLTPTPVSNTNSTSLKSKLSEHVKEKFQEVFRELDKTKLWYLEATKRAVEESGGQAQSVEEKMLDFGMKCIYLHPCHSFILDLDDANWETVFSKEELVELRSVGVATVRPIPKLLVSIVKDIKSMTAKEVYSYAHELKHDPTTDHMLTWLSLTLVNSSSLFLCENTGFGDDGEADVMYERWAFLKTIFRGSSIRAKGKEITSKASRDGRNAKRKLSAMEEIQNVKMGRRMDDVYEGSGVELGAMEIGQHDDTTKEFRDARLKLPMVMKDMLNTLVYKAPNLVREVHIAAYSINGRDVQLLDMDCPRGYVARIRRTNKLPFPSSHRDYAARIVSLLKLAANGKTIMQETESKYIDYELPLDSLETAIVLPPSFTNPTSPSSSTASSKKSKS